MFHIKGAFAGCDVTKLLVRTTVATFDLCLYS